MNRANQSHDTSPPNATSPDRDQRLPALFENWLLARERGQEVPISELCRDCPELAAALAAEIELHQRFDPAARSGPALPEPPAPAFAGLRYQPLRYHAQGGLGVVFVARDREVGRDVALKQVQPRRRHLPHGRERFQREAEITGQLEHPGIVPVYSIGRDAAGQPYYTMRLVEGRTLSRAIEEFHHPTHPPRQPGERNQGLRSLLTHFVAVCQTIAYAHSRGVVHRDLKPSNVLLGDYGETLVIDWGLARRAGEAEQPATASDQRPFSPDASWAQTGREMGTREMMSPEQARGDWERVGPPSDIFSLGATLYAVLTGRPPYAGPGALDDARACRFPRPRQVSREVPPALQAICLKAMALEPGARYPGALELADDVRRWLDDEPVHAFPEPLPQRLWRWARQNRTLATSGLVLLLASLVALSLGLFLVGREQARAVAALEAANDNLRRAVAAEKQAKENLRRAEGNLQLAQQAIDECFNVAREHPLFQQPRMNEAKKLLLAKTLPFYRDFRRQRPKDAALRQEEAEQWLRVATIEHLLGRPQKARQAYEQTRALLDSHPNPRAPQRQAHLARTHQGLGRLFFSLGQREEALKESRRALALQKQLAQAHPQEPAYQHALASTHDDRGCLLAALGRRQEALREHRRARDLLAKLVRADPKEPAHRHAMASTHRNMGQLLHALGKHEEALTEHQHARDLQQKLLAAQPDVPEYQEALAATHINVGTLLFGLGRREQALVELRQACSRLARLTRDHPDVPAYQHQQAITHVNLGFLLAALGRGEEALKEHQEARDILTRLVASHPRLVAYNNDLARTFLNRGEALAGLGRFQQALQEYHQGLLLQVKLFRAHPKVPEHFEVLARLCLNRALLLAWMRQPKPALASFDHAVIMTEELQRLDAGSPHVRPLLLLSLPMRAALRDYLGQGGDADWDRALALTPAPERGLLRLQRSACWLIARVRLLPR